MSAGPHSSTRPRSTESGRPQDKLQHRESAPQSVALSPPPLSSPSLLPRAGLLPGGGRESSATCRWKAFHPSITCPLLQTLSQPIPSSTLRPAQPTAKQRSIYLAVNPPKCQHSPPGKWQPTERPTDFTWEESDVKQGCHSCRAPWQAILSNEQWARAPSFVSRNRAWLFITE